MAYSSKTYSEYKKWANVLSNIKSNDSYKNISAAIIDDIKSVNLDSIKISSKLASYTSNELSDALTYAASLLHTEEGKKVFSAAISNDPLNSEVIRKYGLKKDAGWMGKLFSYIPLFGLIGAVWRLVDKILSIIISIISLTSQMFKSSTSIKVIFNTDLAEGIIKDNKNSPENLVNISDSIKTMKLLWESIAQIKWDFVDLIQEAGFIALDTFGIFAAPMTMGLSGVAVIAAVGANMSISYLILIQQMAAKESVGKEYSVLLNNIKSISLERVNTLGLEIKNHFLETFKDFDDDSDAAPDT